MLWIDTICIDQASSQDLGHQVGMMAEIFTRGSRCLAYLGSVSRDHGERAATTIHVLRDHVLTEMSVAELSGNGFGSKDTQLAPLIVGCTKDIVDALRRVLMDPWFKRLWVLQEVTLSTCTLLRLEGATIELGHLLQLFEYLMLDQYRNLGEYESIALAPHAPSLGYMAWLRRKASPELDTLQTLLLIGSHYEVADVRDRVYAVLDIFQRGRGVAKLPQCLTPDYHKNSHEVLREATHYAIEETQSLHLWHAQKCKPEDLPTSGVSSWVPLLRSAYSLEDRPIDLTAIRNTYGADGHRFRPQDHFDGAGMVLVVEGFVLDTICAWTDSLRFSDFDVQGLRFLQDAIDLFDGRFQAPNVDLQDLERTLVAGEQKQA
ncbi:hypothetical protein LTR95_012553 [Oleoguttula sp. CCFEE 5521]